MQFTKNYVWLEDEKSFLGGGTFGSVYKGEDRRTGKLVAVKVCQLPEGDDTEIFIEDIKQLREFSSPYITRYYAAEEISGSYPLKRIIVMELADGSLANELKKTANLNGIPKQAFLVLVDNCVKALEYLHSKKLAHRDLKPLNVLTFRRQEEPLLVFKICDFGTMRLLNAQDQIISTYRPAGTRVYWPSLMLEREAACKKLEYTKDELDVWSTAYCFFEAATGRLPFLPVVGPGFHEALLEVLENRPPNVVCANFDKETEKYVYLKAMPPQHKSYTRSFRDVLGKYFQLLFNKDKAYLKLQEFSSLSNEMVSIKEYEYYCVNTAKVGSYCDTSSSQCFSSKTFLDEISEVISSTAGDLGRTCGSVTNQRICEALRKDTEEILISHVQYEEPLIAVLLSFQLSQHSSHPHCVATLRDTSNGVRLELQNNANVVAMEKNSSSIRQLIGEKAFSSLDSYLQSRTDRAKDAIANAALLPATVHDEDTDAVENLRKAGAKANFLDPDGNTIGVVSSMRQQSENYVWFENFENCLGKGTFSAVFKGKNSRTGNEVAVKVVPRSEWYKPDTENTDLLQTFKSQYIVKYYTEEEVITSFPRKRAIVMEIADGTLAYELKNEANLNGIPKQEFLVLVDNCVKALEYLDIKNVAFSNLKPKNVLVFRRKEEPLLVFKLSCSGTSHLDELRTRRMGTPACWPSSMLSAVMPNIRSVSTENELNVWMIASCFFAAATGRLPFIPALVGDFHGVFELLRNRPPYTVCAQFDEETKRNIYLSELPRQHKSYTRSFRNVLKTYFQLLFNQDKAYLQLQEFSSLSREMLSIKEYEYYCLNTSTVEFYCDTSSSLYFSRKTFLDEIMKVVNLMAGGLDIIHTSATNRRICEALKKETIEIRIFGMEYKDPLVAVLLPLKHSQASSRRYCAATLRDTSDGVRLVVQDDVSVKAIKKIDCNIEQLVGEEAFQLLEPWFRRSQAANGRLA